MKTQTPIMSLEDELTRIKAERDALLAALQAIVFADSEFVRDTNMPIWRNALRHARAAIALTKHTKTA
jgi:hypothetical protein